MNAHPLEPSFDRHGYPTDDTLQVIREWQSPFRSLMEYMKKAWRYADFGCWRQNGDAYYISTGGWSGNEELVGALQENVVFWGLCWHEHRRGGHYVFVLNDPADQPTQPPR